MPPIHNAAGAIINADDLTVDNVVGQRVLCPACGHKTFEHWPYGWDAHAANQCNVAGANSAAKKAVFKQRFGHLFR